MSEILGSNLRTDLGETTERPARSQAKGVESAPPYIRVFVVPESKHGVDAGGLVLLQVLSDEAVFLGAGVGVFFWRTLGLGKEMRVPVRRHLLQDVTDFTVLFLGHSMMPILARRSTRADIFRFVDESDVFSGSFGILKRGKSTITGHGHRKST